MFAGLFGELRQRAVVIQARHRSEVARIEVLRIRLGDERVGVGRIADDQHFHLPVRNLVESLALRRENLRVGEQEILALHAGTAGPGADEHGDVAIPEGNFGIVGGDDLVERREGAVVELHHDALQAGQSRRDFEQMQVHGLIRTQHLAGGDAEGEGITDLTGGAGDRDVQGRLHGDAYL